MARDSVGDFLTIIRNGVMRSGPFVVAPFSTLRLHVAQILHQEGFIDGVAVIEEEGKQLIKVGLKYVDGESVIHNIKRISRPGRRWYAGSKMIKPVIGGLGISIVSTSQGVMTDKQAKQLVIGGEVLCTVW